MNSVIYTTATGLIKRFATNQGVEQAIYCIADTESVLFTELSLVSARTHYVDLETGELVPYTQAQQEELANRPKAPGYDWNPSMGAWQDVRTLEQVKAAKWEAIKAKRTQVEFGTFFYNGMEFDGDVDAQRRLMNYISVSKSALLSGQPFSADFILANNTVVTLTAEDFVAIELAKVQSVAAAFAQAVSLRTQIESANTKEEIDSLNWL